MGSDKNEEGGRKGQRQNPKRPGPNVSAGTAAAKTSMDPRKGILVKRIKIIARNTDWLCVVEFLRDGRDHVAFRDIADWESAGGVVKAILEGLVAGQIDRGYVAPTDLPTPRAGA